MNTLEKTNRVKKLITKLKKMDIRVALVDGNLDIEAPEHLLTDELLDEIKSVKQELIEVISAYKERKEITSEIIPLPAQSSFLLSASQKRIWILSQFEAINVAYNMPGAYEFRGPLDLRLFKAAFDRVIARHESLRTVFRENENREVHQFIKTPDDIGFEIEYEDMREVAEADSLLPDHLEQLSVQPFDLENGPMLRASLFRVEDLKYIFFFNMHHIISDGWSMGVLIRDIVLFYNALIEGKDVELPDLQIQYKDYAAWQLNELSGAAMEAHRTYWVDRFRQDIPVLDLPIANMRPALKTNHGAMVHGQIDAQTVKQLSDMLKREGGTLFMGLLAGVKALLYRYSGQEDIVVGSPVAGRDHPGLSDQIGFYINTLALRTRFSGSDDFKTLYRRVKEVTLEGFKLQSYPFDELVGQLDLKRDLSRSALFDVMVAIQNNEDEARAFRLGDVEISQYAFRHVTSKFDLIFNFTEVWDEVHYTIEYNTDLYPGHSIARMREHFENLLGFVVKKPGVSIDHIDFLTATEKDKWQLYNQTTIPYPEGKNLMDLFNAQVAETPEHVALIYDEQTYTYCQLHTLTCQLANHLNSFGSQLNRPIPIVSGKGPEQIWGILGILLSGAHYIPIKADWPAARVNELITQLDASLVLVQPDLLHKVQQPEEVSVLLLQEEVIQGQPAKCNIQMASETDLAYIIFTSGSTGKPKGVMIDHRAVVNTLYDINARFKVTGQDVVFGISDISFDLSVYDIFGTFAAGASLILPKDTELQDPDAWLSYVSKYGVTIWDSVPQLVNLLVASQAERPDSLLTSLRVYFMSGDWIPTDLPGRINDATPDAEIISMGGATEGSIWSIHYPINQVNPEWKSVPYGMPLGNQEMYILNEALEPCPFMVPGGIFIGGKGVAKGYFKDEEKTSYSFIEHPVSKQPLYRTGDYGLFHPDGYIVFLGRRDGQVKVRGYRIETGEIQSIVHQHPDVKECIVSTTPLEGKDRELVTYIVSHKPVSQAKMAAYLRTYLPEYMVPTYFIQIDKIPLTANGKVDRKALPDPVQEQRQTDSLYIAPESDIQTKLADIWGSILNLDADKIGIDDNFFELGGHSLKVTQLKSMISQTFNIRFKINELFTYTTIRAQAQLIEESASENYNVIPRVETADYYLLSSSQRRLWILCQFEQANVAYNIGMAYEIQGDLQLDLLEMAFHELMVRHEILRTVFNTQEDGEVYQQVRDSSQIDTSIRYVDLQGVRDRENLLRSTLNEEVMKPFDLENGPLLSIAVYQLDKDRQVLFLNMHHIISDGWSLEVLLQEILSVYHSRLNREILSLRELTLQYKDYAHWQRQQLEGDQLEKHKAWWLELFSDTPPVLELPAAYQRPAVQTHHGAKVRGIIPAKISVPFKELLQANGATLFMGLLAGVKSLLYRYTGLEDMVIGSPVAGREHEELKDQIGLYIGMLALRTRFSGEEGFVELLNRVREVAMGAYEHQAYPFDELVAALDPKRDTSRSVLFDGVVILHNNTKRSKANELSGFSMKPFDFEQDSSKYDITFNFAEAAETIEYAIEYNTDIYGEEQINQMALHLSYLLGSIVNESTSPLYQLSYLSPKEETKLLVEFNNTACELPASSLLLSRFASQVSHAPDDIAVVFDSKKLTYTQLDEKSNHLAGHLAQLGVRKGDLVGVYLERSEQIMVALLAIWKAGAAYVPLDPAYPKDRIALFINDAGIRTILSQTRLAFKLPAFNGQLVDIDQLSDETTDSYSADVQMGDLAYVIYTSGSTGKPKGVQVTHRNLANFLLGMDQKIGHNTGDSLLAVTTISFDISLLELFWTLANGMKVVIMPTQNLSGASPQTSTRNMDFSLFYFASEVEEQNKYRLLIEGAKFADQHGFSAVWTPERHFHEFGGIYPNPSITGAAIASITEHIQIRSGSCVLPLHNPIRIAEEWSVVDNLSNGRVGISFASGWVMNDFLAFAPDSYDSRYDLLYEGIDKVKSLWSGDSITLSNPKGEDAEVQIFPKPLQKELPIWITAAGSPDTFRTAGEKGANLLTHLLGQTVDELREKITIYRDAYRSAGHKGSGHVTLMIHTFVGDDMEAVRQKVRDPFRHYLKNSVGLLRSLGKSIGQDVDDDNFKSGDMEALLDHAFERYTETAALFGTPESCLEMANRLNHAGVDELGCLIDFGLEFQTAFDGLQNLNAVKEMYEAQIGAAKKYRSFSSMLREHQISHLQCTPSALKMLLEEDGAADLPSLRHLMVGGEALPVALADQVHNTWDVDLHNMYGPTETTVWSATHQIEKDSTSISIGKPIANTQIYILDRYKHLVPLGVAGEIYIGGVGVTKGYLNRPELTDERFVPHPYAPSGLLYRTGDLGKWTTDGNVEFLGRVDDQMKVRGHRIEPGEIEAILREYPGVSDLVVAAHVNKEGENELAAYIISKEELNSTELRSFLAKKLPAYMIPSHFVRLESFPLTLNGKIDKKSLSLPQSARVTNGTEYVKPRNHEEMRLVEAWSELLGKDKETIGIHENFFELGGQSLSAIRLMGIIGKELNMKIPLSLIFENPTIYEFMGWLNMYRDSQNAGHVDEEAIEIEEIL